MTWALSRSTSSMASPTAANRPSKRMKSSRSPCRLPTTHSTGGAVAAVVVACCCCCCCCCCLEFDFCALPFDADEDEDEDEDEEESS